MSIAWVDILSVIIAMTLLKGAITGTFYSSGRGTNRPLFASVKAVPARLAIFLVAVGLLAWAIRDYLHKI